MMIRQLFGPATILTGIGMLTACSFAQTYTVSAKPGAVNFIEGDVSLNSDPVWTSNLKSTFLNSNDVLAVKNGKAEVLLTPGVFLRVGENSEVRMVKPSLIETQIEIVSGESMIEVDDLVPGSSVSVLDHGSSTTLIKPGLYRFTGHSIASLEGKAEISLGGQTIQLKKNKEVELSNGFAAKKVDLSQADELYAWSNVRAQYNAAATYAGSRDAYSAGGYGYSSFTSPGWYWNSPYSTYMWMPGNGAFYSPFGWGFYGPGVVAYAPVVSIPYSGGGGYYAGRGAGAPVKTSPTATASNLPANITKHPIMVPINPRNMGVANFTGTSPAAFAAARLQMQQSANFYTMRTANGAPAANLRNGQTFSDMHAASRAAASSARSTASGAAESAGWSAGSQGSSGGSSSGARNASSGGWSGGHAGGSIGGGGGVASHASGGGHSAH